MISRRKLEGATPEEIKLKKLIELIKNYCEFFPDLYKWKWSK